MADPMPERVEPMLAVAGELPAGREDDDYGYEIKWDGVRAVAYVSGGRVRLTGRHLVDITVRYPEAARLGELVGARHVAVFDGEIVAFDAAGRPSFAALQPRIHISDPERRGLTRQAPVSYVLFDLLHLDGHTLFSLPYTWRRELLNDLDLTAGAIQVPAYQRGDGAELLAATRERGLEGLVAKRLDSPYEPGRRVDFWRKVKNLRTQEVVIAGWRPGKGRRAGGVGSLLLGVHDRQGRLHYVGHVGTGFTDEMLAELTRLLRPLGRRTSPFAEEVPRADARDARWARPCLVGEVAYSSWTRDHRLRAPSWRGLRPDKHPQEVTGEP